MKQVHTHEKEQFKKLFTQEHIDNFEDRFKILDVFLQTEQHVTHKELLQLLEESGYKADPDLVRDTLKLMSRYGFAQASRFDKGAVRYEHRHLGQHHDHMICTRCRKIIEFRNEQLESLQLQIAAAHGFHMLQHRMEIYGICSECLKERAQLIPLVMAKQGERLVIKEFTGGKAAQMHLFSMGLKIGDKIEVVTNMNGGQVVIAIDYNRLAIGQGLAQKVLVQPE